MGYSAGSAILTGIDNVLIGSAVGDALTTGTANVAVGRAALSTENTGSRNVAIGYNALGDLDYNGDGYNVAVGYSAGGAISSGVRNTIVGGSTGSSIDTAVDNTIIGQAAGDALTGGNDNTLVGMGSGFVLTGENNTFVGRRSGYNVTTGDFNICIGTVDASSATVSDEVNIGTSAITARFQGAAAAWSFVSDERDKKEIKDLELGVNFVNKLKPRKFKWDLRNSDVDKDKEASGFVAQEIQEVLDQTDTNYTGLVDTNNPDQYTVAQSNLIPILVKAVQELSAEVKQLKQQLNN